MRGRSPSTSSAKGTDGGSTPLTEGALELAVYVDDARIGSRGRRWSHMVAESAEELHRAAAALGLPRAAAQSGGQTLHYDLPDEWRDRAIRLGFAVPIHWRELVRRRRAMAPGRRATVVLDSRSPPKEN